MAEQWFGQAARLSGPLKARRNDAGLGKLDLLGVTETPAALMEALRYAAIVEANHAIIANEAKAAFKVNVSDNLPPAILLLGTSAWWQSWLELKSAGPWAAKFGCLVRDIERETGIPVRCLAIADNVLEGSTKRRFSSIAFV
jgi:hypothetical protein